MSKVSPKFIQSSFCSKKSHGEVYFLRSSRHCNCSENFWSETNRQTGVMVHLSLTYSIRKVDGLAAKAGCRAGPTGRAGALARLRPGPAHGSPIWSVTLMVSNFQHEFLGISSPTGCVWHELELQVPGPLSRSPPSRRRSQ